MMGFLGPSCVEANLLAKAKLCGSGLDGPHSGYEGLQSIPFCLEVGNGWHSGRIQNDIYRLTW